MLSYSLLFLIFIIIIATCTEYLTPGDKYRWVAIKQFIENSGNTDVSFDFRNMSPFYAEIFLILGMIISGESLALKINVLFSFFVCIGVFDFFHHLKKIPHKISLLFTVIFVLNAAFLIDGPRGYISNTVSFFVWMTYIFLFIWYKKNEKKYFYISIIFAGIAAGTKIHALFCILFFSFFVYFFSAKKSELFFSIKSIKNTSLFIFGSLFISSPWYIRNFFFKGDFFYPYLSSSFYSNLEAGTKEAIMLDPTIWSGIEPVIGNVLKPIYLMLSNPLVFSYGWEFGILLISLIPFYFFIKKNKFDLLTLLFILSYYFFWFLSHQNFRYLLYIYPIIFSLPFINLYFIFKDRQPIKINIKIVRISFLLILLNSLFHMALFTNWRIKNMKFDKEKFLSQYDNFLRSNQIDSLVNANHSSPKIISNQRDLYYLKTPISYEEVWYDNIVSSNNIRTLKKKLQDYKEKGFTHIVYHAFSDEKRHKKLLSSGANYIDDVKYLKSGKDERIVKVYEIK